MLRCPAEAGGSKFIEHEFCKMEKSKMTARALRATALASVLSFGAAMACKNTSSGNAATPPSASPSVASAQPASPPDPDGVFTDRAHGVALTYPQAWRRHQSNDLELLI